MATGQAGVGFYWRWLLAFMVLLLAAAGAWQLWAVRQEPDDVLPPVQADRRVLAEGIVFPVRYAQMIMPMDGTIGEVLVTEGSKVKKGQPLIRLVRQDAEARLSTARYQVARAVAAAAQTRINYDDARRELARQQRLEEVGGTSRQQLDQAKAAAERSLAALEQARAELKAQEASLAEAEGLLDKTELRATMDGIVTYLDVKVGEHAVPATVLVRIADPSEWEVRSDDLTELSIAKIGVGDRADLTFDAIPGLEISARVKFIRPYGEKKRGDITYTVTIAPDRWDDRLRWNMTAQIAITPSQ